MENNNSNNSNSCSRNINIIMEEIKRFLKGIEPREYQREIFKTCKAKNCLVVLPTGLGKTLIAIMLTIERMSKYPGEKVLMLAPTKPLVEQHKKAFEKYLPELFGDIQLFTGKIKAEKRKEIWEKADIIISTPQCIANDLKKNLYSLEDVCLLIEDEAHRCVKNYDYTYIAKRYNEQSKHKRIIGLTASPGSEQKKIKEICRNLLIEEVELRTRESKDVKQYLQELEFEKIPVEFPREFKEIKKLLESILNNYIHDLENRKVLFAPPTKTELLKVQKRISNLLNEKWNWNYIHALSSCAQAIRLQHAVELLETQSLESFAKYLEKLFKQAREGKSKGIKQLVSIPDFNKAYILAKELLLKNREHPKIEKLKEILEKKDKKDKIIIFTQFRDTINKIVKEINKITGIKAKKFVGQAGEEGMKQQEQKKIIEEFAEGKINVLCSTSIGEEGLDIPEVKTVIFYEPIPSAIRKIQRAGRTARLNKGELLILITKETRDEAFYYVSKARERKMHKTISRIKEDLSNKKMNTKEKQEILG